MEDARERWWIIGSVAVALHMGGASPVTDVDVLLAADDAVRLIPKLGTVVGPGEPDNHFRSAPFARWTAPPLPVEFMANLHVSVGGEWVPIVPTTREAVELGRATVFVPSAAEMIAILRRFGRPKDLARAAMLVQLAG